jgi:hypothetical protein
MVVSHCTTVLSIPHFNANRFPIQEHGMNWESQPLQKHEREEMRRDPEIVQRVLRSYTLMLDFYGMRLVDSKTGLVDRALPPRNYATRYRNLLRKRCRASCIS